MVSPDRLEAAYQTALAMLLKERTPEGHWVGELSTSALSTATAVMALHLVQSDAASAHRSADGAARRPYHNEVRFLTSSTHLNHALH